MNKKIRFFLTSTLLVMGVFVVTNISSAAVGLQVGNSSLNLGAAENLYYGNIGASSATTSNLLLLQTAGVSKLRVDYYGNLTTPATITAGGFTGPLSGIITAANVSAGAFGANTGGGNYSFPGNVGIGTTTPENAEGWERVLDVYGSSHSKIITTTSAIQTGIWSHNSGFYSAPTGGIAGTKTNHPFSLMTNGVAKLTILSNGNVGIGTTTPATTLDVNGLIKMRTATILSSEDVVNKGYLDSALASTTSGIITQVATSSFWQGSLTGGIYNANTGNVGIGTTNPGYKLAVYDPGAVSGDRLLVGSAADNNGEYTGIRLQNSGIDNAAIRSFLQGGNPNSRLGFFVGDNTGNALSEKLSIVSDGKVGIGTTAPSSKLDIFGEITLGTILNGRPILSQYYSSPYAGLKYDAPGGASGWYGVHDFYTGYSGAISALAMRIINGKVGIGTADPFLGQLHVNKGTAAGLGGDLWITNNAVNTTGNSARLSFGLDNTTDVSSNAFIQAIVTNSSGYLTDLIFGTYGTGGLAERMRINSSGNVGIGTTAPNDKLSIGLGGSSAPAGSDSTGHNYTNTYLSTDDYALTNYGLVKTLIAGGSGSSVGYWTMSGTNIYNSNSGNVGIGTTNPTAKLHVNLGVGSASNSVKIDNTSAGGYSSITLRDDRLSDSYGGQFGLYGTTAAGNASNVFFYNYAGGGLDFYAGSGAVPANDLRMRITSVGNVGIGTTTPITKLHVAGDGLFEGDGSIPNAPTTVGFAFGKSASDSNRRMEIVTPASGISYIDFTNPGVDFRGRILYDTASNYFALSTNAGERLRITSTGSVGIGVTNPNAKLGVVGAGIANTPLTLAQFFNTIPYAPGNGLGAARIELGHGTGLHGYIEAGSHSEGDSSRGYLAFGNRQPTNSIVEVMRISPTGNVGIGTTAPNDKLSIGLGGSSAPAGSDSTGHNYTNTYLSTDDYALANYGLVKTLVANATSSLANSIGLWGGTKNGNIWNGDAGAGNVGIGTTNPGTYKLNVVGNSYFNGDLTVSGKITGVKNKINTVNNNLGSPTVEEMALFHGQFSNKFRFLTAVLQEESSDGVSWSNSSRLTNDQLADLMIGEGQYTSTVAIPAPTVGGSGYYRLTWDSPSYMYLDALYIYNSTNGNQVNFKIEAYHNTNGWTEITNGSISNWPGHTYIPHSNIPFSSTNPSQYGKVRVTFSISSATYANPFNLYSVEWFGGYPAGRRNAEYYDRYKNVTFPASIRGGSGSASSPTFSFASDTSTGIYSGGSGVLRFVNSGSDKMTILSNGNVGIGTNNPIAKNHIISATTSSEILQVIGSGLATNAYTGVGFQGYIAGNAAIKSGILHQRLQNYGVGNLMFAVNDVQDNSNISLSDVRMTINSSGSVGIGTTNPTQRLEVNGNAIIRSGSFSRIFMGGGGGDNFGIAFSSSYPNHGIFYQEGANDFIALSPNGGGTSTPVLMANQAGNVGIGTTGPLDKFSIGMGGVAAPAGSDGTGHNNTQTYVGTDNYALANVGYVKSLMSGSYLPLSGGTMTGDVNFGGKNITNLNALTVSKITATTIDPLYNIKGINYSTFAPSVSGGVKEEYVGKASIKRYNSEVGEYEYVVDFDLEKEGSDLWVWRQVVDYSDSNVQVTITPSGKFAAVYYLVRGNQLVLRSDRAVEVSYRLIANRYDWRDWPTKANDQSQRGVIIK